MITDDQKQAVEDWLASKLNAQQANRPRWQPTATVSVFAIVALGLWALLHELARVYG